MINKLRFWLGISLIVVYILLGLADLWLKRWSTGCISLLLSAVNGLIFFG